MSTGDIDVGKTSFIQAWEGKLFNSCPPPAIAVAKVQDSVQRYVRLFCLMC